MSVKHPKTIDYLFLGLIIALVVVGFFIFSSASLGLLARGNVSMSSVAFSQFFFGIIGGALALTLTTNIFYRNWRQYALYIFLAAIFVTLLVFVPGLGMSHGGATRWLDLGFTTIQPSEFLKIAFVIYVATLFSGTHQQIGTWRYGVLPFLAVLLAVAAITLSLPDTDTFFIMATAGFAMFITAGAKIRHVVLMGLAALSLVAVMAFSHDYVMNRLITFINPDQDSLTSGYQIQQSLIAVGSGGWLGRGYGQSIQKFSYLPEPIGDSIFAVFAEEFGFIGSLILILAFSIFTFRGYRIAAQASDVFGMLLVVGFMTMIAVQAFLNIAAMIGVAPLAGLPLPFISHGGTALLAILASLGIVLNVSKYRIGRT
jgi:cell division protein FtsW